MRTVSAKVFCKVFQSLAAASRKALGLKTAQTVCGEFDEFTGPKIEGRMVEVHNKQDICQPTDVSGLFLGLLLKKQTSQFAAVAAAASLIMCLAKTRLCHPSSSSSSSSAVFFFFF